MQDWLTIAWMCMVMVSGEAAETPGPASCACSWDRGRGDMRAIPVNLIERSAEVVHISAPPDKTNFLTIGPIFTQPTPYVNLRELLNSYVSFIGQYSFWGLHNLRLINLTHNLTSIGVDNFRGHINLTDLHLERNDFEQMSSSYGLDQLSLSKQLDLKLGAQTVSNSDESLHPRFEFGKFSRISST